MLPKTTATCLVAEEDLGKIKNGGTLLLTMFTVYQNRNTSNHKVQISRIHGIQSIHEIFI
jgi:hypothetical protein